MTLEFAGISLRVDSTDAVTAKANLDAMAKAGTSSAAAFSQVEAGARTAGAALSGTAAAAAAGARGVAATASGARTAADGLRATGQQAKLTGQQTAQLSAQLQDFFIQVQAGGSPLTALIQQGSQLSAVFGGVAPALRAVGGVLLTTATAYSALAAAGLGLGAAFLIGREQSADLTRGLILSGNAAGITEGQFNSLSRAIADSTNTTIGSTRDTLAELASSGRITGEVLSGAATAVQLLGKITGQSSAEIAKEFAKAADAPARFAEETNRSYNFLTSSQLAYIKSLEDQGRGQEALAFTFEKLNTRLQQAAGSTTVLGKAFQDAKNDVSAFFDALVGGLGRTDTAEQKLESVKAKLDELQRAGQKGYVFGPSVADLQAEQAGLERTIAGQREVAAIKGRDAQREQDRIRFDKLREQSLTKQQQLTKALADANALADKAGVSQQDRQGVLASIRQRFTPGGGGGEARAALANDLAVIRAAEAQKLTIYRNTEGVIDALRSAGVLRDADYYDAKRAYVRLDQQAQEEAINAEIARLQAFRGTAAENLSAQREIVQARASLAQVQAAGAAKVQILTIQEKGAVDALKRSYEEMGFAAGEADRASLRRNAFVAGTAGAGDAERQRAADEFNVRERFFRQLEQLEAQNRAGAFQADQEQFAKRRTRLLDSQEFELQRLNEFYAAQDAIRERWENGFSAGVSNVIRSAGETAERTKALTEDAFRGLGDALTDVFTTGKADWRSLEKTIVSGITRIIIEEQAIRPLAAFLGGGSTGGGVGGLLGSLFSSAVGSFFGGGGSGMPDGVPTRGGRAAGGRVEAGGLYPVNELASHGPGEILTSGGRQYLMARESGYVQPMQAGRSGMQQVINFLHSTGPVDRRTQQQIATAAGRGAQQAMARNG